jgi:hypothetical protein
MGALSGIPIPPSYSAFSFRTFLQVIGRSELYELTRNWRIGVELAGERPFTLVNLVVKDSDPVRTEEFRAGLNPQRGHFLVIRWHDFTAGFNNLTGSSRILREGRHLGLQGPEVRRSN